MICGCTEDHLCHEARVIFREGVLRHDPHHRNQEWLDHRGENATIRLNGPEAEKIRDEVSDQMSLPLG